MQSICLRNFICTSIHFSPSVDTSPTFRTPCCLAFVSYKFFSTRYRSITQRTQFRCFTALVSFHLLSRRFHCITNICVISRQDECIIPAKGMPLYKHSYARLNCVVAQEGGSKQRDKRTPCIGELAGNEISNTSNENKFWN